MPQTQKITVKQYFLSQNMIYIALIVGQMLFAAVTVYLRSSGQMSNETGELTGLLQYLVPLVSVGGAAGGFQLFKIMLQAAKKQSGLSDKVSRYGTALIVRYALLEAPSLFSIVSYFLTGNYLFLAIAGVIIVLFLFIRPTKEKLEQDLELNQSELAQTSNPDAVIMERKFTS
ncbi:MAG: hypothetical protein MUD08_05895 [Cytophagales bacterium]|nr:hypothetical protein [Cytophagales bacterium]